jgi:ABC-2 type transport system ATP-binding protein
MYAVEAHGLGKQFGSFSALRDCDLALPVNRVIGLVGPNGAGKTTLLQLAAGLRYPTSGSIEVLGTSPGANDPALLARMSFVAQERPLYADFSVADNLEAARRLNIRWDHDYAIARVRRFGIPLDAKVRRLSTGQKAQVALAIAIGKRPELLILDEPVANLDPLARVELLEELMSAVAMSGPTILMSANALADVDRICEYIVILTNGRVRLAGDIDEIAARHAFVAGPRTEPLPAGWVVVDAREAERQGTWILRAEEADLAIEPRNNGTIAREATLEEIVLAYLRSSAEAVCS